MAGLELAPYFPETFNPFNIISSAASLIIDITGTILCYRANRNGDNDDFIGRMICLSWPILIRVVVLFAIFLVVFAQRTVAIVLISDSDTAMFMLVALLEIYFYCLLYKYVKLVAQPKEALGKPIWRVCSVGC